MQPVCDSFWALCLAWSALWSLALILPVLPQDALWLLCPHHPLVHGLHSLLSYGLKTASGYFPEFLETMCLCLHSGFCPDLSGWWFLSFPAPVVLAVSLGSLRCLNGPGVGHPAIAGLSLKDSLSWVPSSSQSLACWEGCLALECSC